MDYLESTGRFLSRFALAASPPAASPGGASSKA